MYCIFPCWWVSTLLAALLTEHLCAIRSTCAGQNLNRKLLGNLVSVVALGLSHFDWVITVNTSDANCVNWFKGFWVQRNDPHPCVFLGSCIMHYCIAHNHTFCLGTILQAEKEPAALLYTYTHCRPPCIAFCLFNAQSQSFMAWILLVSWSDTTQLKCYWTEMCFTAGRCPAGGVEEVWEIWTLLKENPSNFMCEKILPRRG